jgi:hypothetical protein
MCALKFDVAQCKYGDAWKNNGACLCALKFVIARCRVGDARKNNGTWVCALKFGVVWCKVVMRGKIMVCGCVHLNLVLHGAELVMPKMWSSEEETRIGIE